MKIEELNKNISIETMLESFPSAGTFFLRWGIRCFACSGPIWGTIGEVLENKGVENIDEIVEQLKEHIRQNSDSAK